MAQGDNVMKQNTKPAQRAMDSSLERAIQSLVDKGRVRMYVNEKGERVVQLLCTFPHCGCAVKIPGQCPKEYAQEGVQ